MDKKTLMKKVTSLPNHYSTIDNLTLYRWDKYTQTKDNNWFLVDYDGRQKKIESDALNKVEESIIDQYFTAIDDRSFSIKLQKWGKINQLKTKYDVVDALLNRMWIGFVNDVQQMEVRYLIIQQLRSWGFKFPELNSSVADRDLIIQFRTALEGIKTQIAIIKGELKEDGKKEAKNIQRQISFVEVALGVKINEREISLARWIAYWQDIQERSKNN